jgi:hypothetical protein
MAERVGGSRGLMAGQLKVWQTLRTMGCPAS